jgi:hypothetical protein
LCKIIVELSLNIISKFIFSRKITMNKLFMNKSLAVASIVAMVSVFGAGTAHALIEGELSVGQRDGTFKADGASGKSLTGTTVQLAGHLDPIPLVPVSFGLRIINETYSPTVAKHGFKDLTSTAFVPEVSAWIPLLGDIKPFARLGYTLVSAYKGRMEASVAGATVAGDVVYESKGVRLAAGVNYSFMPFVSLSAAVEQSSEKLTTSEAKFAGVDIKSQVADVSFNSTAILVGVKAGL